MFYDALRFAVALGQVFNSCNLRFDLHMPPNLPGTFTDVQLKTQFCYLH